MIQFYTKSNVKFLRQCLSLATVYDTTCFSGKLSSVNQSRKALYKMLANLNGYSEHDDSCRNTDNRT